MIAGRGALKLVIDLYDSLALAGRSLERTLEMVRAPLDAVGQTGTLPPLPEWPVDRRDGIGSSTIPG